MAFNGFGMHLGNLSRVSAAKTRSISPENFTGEKGKAGMATEGHRRRLRARPGAGVEDLPVHRYRAGRDARTGGYRRSRRHPADLDDPHRPLALQHPAHLLGRPGAASVECPVGDFFACGWGSTRRSLRCPSA